MQPSLFIILALMVLIGAAALARGKGGFEQGVLRGIEQVIKLLPRMLCALIGASFLVKLIPTEVIGTFLGKEAGLVAILIGALTGLIIPAGPVVSFSLAAVLANEGASLPALVSFITSWSIHAMHRIFIYEVPLLGFSFLRLRLASVVTLPLAAGGLTLAAMKVLAMLPT
jgi:uncharacterized membrane protein YraQ (UPF0718 family)